MRKFLLAIAAITALLGTSAFAADMAVKAPPPPPTPASAYSWTGFYAGGNAGYGWKDPTATFTPDTFTVLLVTCHNFFCPPPASFNIQGALGGLQIGYNWQINQNWLVGFETDFNWSDVKGTGTSNFVFGDPTTSSNFQAFENIKWFGTVRARLGYLPTNNLLLYGTGGLAYGRIDENVSLNSTRSGFTDGSTSFVCTDPLVSSRKNPYGPVAQGIEQQPSKRKKFALVILGPLFSSRARLRGLMICGLEEERELRDGHLGHAPGYSSVPPKRGGGLDHEISNFCRLRKHRQVARWKSQGLCAHSFRRILLLIGRNHSIVRGNNKPTWLRVPSRCLDGRPEDRAVGCPLGSEHKTLQIGRKVLPEVLNDAFSGQQKETVLDRLNCACAGRRRILLPHAAECLAHIGRKSCDINEAGDFRVVSGFGNDRAAVGMADQKYRSVLRVYDAVCRCHVIGNRTQGILDGYDVQTIGLQGWNEFRPT